MIQKVQSEKERVNETHRERILEFEVRMKKVEAEKVKIESDCSRIVRDKEGAFKELQQELIQKSQIL